MANRPIPAITAAIDAAAAEVVVPSLRERRYRKVRHHWWRDTDGARQAVTVQSSQSDSVATGGFTVEFGFSYPSIGEDRPDKPGAWFCRHRVRIGRLLPGAVDRWWWYENAADPHERARNVEAFREAWTTYGLPFLERMAGPDAFLDYLLHDPVNQPSGMEAIELAEALGSRPDLDRAIDAYLAELRTDRLVPEDATLDPYPAGHLALYYADVLPHLSSAGRSLEGDDLERAREAVDETVRALGEGHHRERYMYHGRGELLARLGDVLGIDARGALGT